MNTKRLKRILACVLAAAIVAVPFAANAATSGAETSQSAAPTADAAVAAKNESVYAILSASGEVDTVHVVNHFELDAPGAIRDSGTYTDVINLTTTDALNYAAGIITAQADGDSFYYQGNMSGATLPWTFDISYTLDGSAVTAEALAGGEGALEISMKSAQTTGHPSEFYDNYMLQITITLSSDKCTGISAPGSTVAVAGKNKVITYTVMPGSDADIKVTANVRDFEMSGITVAAMPYSMDIETPDTGEMVDGVQTLADAITDLNSGVTELKDGVADMKSGAASLSSGSAEIGNGLAQLSANSDGLVAASAEINTALNTIAASMAGGGADGADLSALAEVPAALTSLSGALKEVAGGMGELRTGFTAAYGALDSAMDAIPGGQITQEQIAALYAAAGQGQQATVEKLVAAYTAALTAKGTYDQVKTAFDAVGSTLDTLSAAVTQVASGLDEMAAQLGAALSGSDMMQQLAQLQAGLSELSAGYAQFHSGLTAYTDGVNGLSSGYGSYSRGVGEFASGVGELYSGIAELSDGTGQLDEEVSSMPGTMQTEIDDMMGQYTGNDFTPVSFTSADNENIGIVQFVIRCEGVEKAEAETAADVEEAEETFWDRVKALFSKE